MIKLLIAKDISSYLMAQPNSVLLDVRTKEEWNTIGKPDGEKIGLKTYSLFYILSMLGGFLLTKLVSLSAIQKNI